MFFISKMYSAANVIPPWSSADKSRKATRLIN